MCRLLLQAIPRASSHCLISLGGRRRISVGASQRVTAVDEVSNLQLLHEHATCFHECRHALSGIRGPKLASPSRCTASLCTFLCSATQLLSSWLTAASFTFTSFQDFRGAGARVHWVLQSCVRVCTRHRRESTGNQVALACLAAALVATVAARARRFSLSALRHFIGQNTYRKELRVESSSMCMDSRMHVVLTRQH